MPLLSRHWIWDMMVVTTTSERISWKCCKYEKGGIAFLQKSASKYPLPSWDLAVALPDSVTLAGFMTSLYFPQVLWAQHKWTFRFLGLCLNLNNSSLSLYDTLVPREAKAMFALFCWWHLGVVSYNIILQNNPELVGVIMTDFHIKGTDSERLYNLAQVLPLVSG